MAGSKHRATGRRKHYPISVRPARLHPDDQWVDPIPRAGPQPDVTVGERVVSLLGIGMPLDHAGAAVGLSPPEIRHWLRVGIGVLAQDAAGRDWPSFTHDERALASFAYAAITAEGDWIARQHATLEQASRTGTVKTTTTTTSAAGVIQTMVREQQIPGDWRVVMWRLSTRFPNVYGPRNIADTSMGVDVSNEPDTRDRLRDRLAGIGRRLALPPGQETPE